MGSVSWITGVGSEMETVGGTVSGWAGARSVGVGTVITGLTLMDA
jgi:hypothetical protein